MTHNPASAIQDLLVFGEFGDVNPSVTDSVTYTFLSPKTMEEVFEHEIEGCFLYSRHWNPINRYLSQALAGMEGTEAAQVTASGMSAITSTMMQLAGAGDEVVSARTIYGGTFALLKNFLPRFGVTTRFVDITDLKAIEKAITPKTKVLYAETVSNPLLEMADIPALAQLAHAHGIKLVIDNTFVPMLITPAAHGADVVVYSLTKFANGTSDAVAGCICGSKELIGKLTDVNSGACMLMGPVLDSTRAASILKNLHSLHVRMRQHSKNAMALAQWLSAKGLKVHYPGLESHPQHALFGKLMRPDMGFGGMMTLDAKDAATASKLMAAMQKDLVGYLAVSLGYFKTLFSAPGSSTSSEIPKDTQAAMGLTSGLIRFSVGLDDDIERTIGRVETSLKSVGLLR